MKWIGQHIYDLISRFRSDVYLEDVSTGTIASGGNLGLDSNNKIVKATETTGDLTSIVAGTGLSGTDLTGPIPTLNVDEVQTQITSIGTISTGVWNGTIIADAYLSSNTAHLDTDQTITGRKTIGTNTKVFFRDTNSYIYSPDANDLEIVATDIVLDAATSIALEGDTTVTGDFTVNGDNVTFQSANADDPIVTIKNTSNASNDMASLKFVKDRGAAPSVGDNLAEIYFVGEDADQNTQEYGRIICETDVVTGGQESGVLKLGVASHDGGASNGLILTGGSVDAEVDVAIGVGAASVTTVAGTLTMGSTAAMGNTGLLTVGAQTGITAAANLITVGTIGTGVWNGTKVASAYLDDDTAHLSGTQTFTGTKTLNSFKGTAGATVTNILDEDAMGSDSAAALATQQSIKAYVDARYTYTYTSFIGISDVATNWAVPHANGWNAYANQWSTDTGVSATSIDTTISVGRLQAASGFTVPFDGVLVGFYATVRNNDNSNQPAVGLFHQSGSAIWGLNGATNFALKAYATASYAGGAGSSYKGACKAIDLTRSLAVTAGDVIIPAILEASTDKVLGNITMVIKTLIPE